MKISPNKEIPPGRQDVTDGSHEKLWDYFKKIIGYLNDTYEDISNSINYNDDYHKPRVISQAAQPQPKKGEVLLWKDTDAVTGDSTHYIVWNNEGTIITFASQETVP